MPGSPAGENAGSGPQGPAACSGCASTVMTRLPMALADGTEVLFLSCNQGERREWLAPKPGGGWDSLPIEVVLQRSTRHR